MIFLKRTPEQIQKSKAEKDFTGGYNFLPWLYFEEKIKALAIIVFFVLSIMLPMPFCIQNSFNPLFQYITSPICMATSLFIYYKTKKQYKQMKNGISL